MGIKTGTAIIFGLTYQTVVYTVFLPWTSEFYPNDPARLRGIITEMTARHEATVSGLAAKHEAVLVGHEMAVDLAAQYEVRLADKDQYIAEFEE